MSNLKAYLDHCKRKLERNMHDIKMIRLYLCSELLFPENETDMFYLMACRTERGLYLNLEDYRRDTCARCYFYLPPFAFRDDNSRLVYDASTGYLIDPWANKTYDADPENVSHPAYATFQSDLFARKWIACCRAALDCCSQMISDPQPNDTEFLLCPRTWDGWQCWPDTPAGQVAEELCEEHIYFMSEPPPCPRFASKQCLSNGSWFINDWDSEWSNYSGCGRIQGIRRLQYFHIVTYAVSILFLLPALIIFIIYKQLQVYRITMHKNLFTALLFNDFMCIVFKCYVILDELEHAGDRRTILEDNGVVCKVLYIATKYTRMTTYMWMFCEGFYLHKLIAASFAEQKSIQMFYFIGWVFPVFPVGTFALLRWYFADEECWAVPVNPYEWVTNSPNLLSLVLNFAFLCNIIRVLVTKLRATHTNEPSQFRKAVRATLVLVPLFGLHFFLVIYRPQYGECTALEVYTFLSYSMDGLQGFLVSLIFCYLNGEIQGLVKRSIQRIRLQRSVTSSSDWRRSTRSEHLSKMRVNGSRKRGAREKIQMFRNSAVKTLVTDLMRRSVYRMRLQYNLNSKPSPPIPMSNVSEMPHSKMKKDSISIEEIYDVY